MTYDLRRVCEHGVITRTPAHPPLPGHRHLARDRLGRFLCHEFNRITSSSPAAGTARSPNRRTAAGGSYIRPAARFASTALCQSLVRRSGTSGKVSVSGFSRGTATSCSAESPISSVLRRPLAARV